MRKVFINTLIELAKEDENIVLITPDLGFSILEGFFDMFPERSFNVGIAEQNAIMVASGLALSGKKPYVYSIIPFVTMRCFEQVRLEAAYMNTNIKIIGVGAGFTYGSAGATHHAIEDIAIIRALPNMKICCPGDNFEVAEILKQSVQTSSPMYIRLGSHDRGLLNTTGNIKIGKASIIETGDDIAIISTSNMLADAFDYCQSLKKEGRKPYLISMHTVKPLDTDLINKLINKNVEIQTLEEHNIIGGLGSAIAEVIAESGKGIKFRRIGIPDKFSHYVGDRQYIKKQFGLYFGEQ